MKISRDKYELPEYVCDSIDQLSRKTGVTTSAIRSEISKFINKKRNTTRFIWVVVEDEEE
ncbi:MAG: hypothetical protein KBT03_12075 [Bacteroidales bacterium]|nr:hypothetical protein [Candidatus Scybalousia scybalohippi]